MRVGDRVYEGAWFTHTTRQYTMESLLPLMTVFLTVLCGSTGHICLVSPHQRGNLDISTSGNPSCFRHGAPCGGMNPEDPKVNFTAGSNVFIKWQQNYNHYSVGYPGYMDLAIAPMSSTDFKLLAVVSDSYAYSQDHQKNYTVLVTIPDMECDHCVLRARYNAHKPGERTFYQCSDVRVTKSQFKSEFKHFMTLPERNHPTLFKAMRLTASHKRRSVKAGGREMYGLMFNPNQPDNVEYVAVDTVTGMMKTMTTLNFGVGYFSKRFQTINPNFLVDGIAAVDLPRMLTVMMHHEKGSNLDQRASSMVALGTTNGSVVQAFKVNGFDGTAYSAVVLESFGLYLTFSIEESTQNPGNYFFVVGHLDWEGMWNELGRTSQTENTYINYQWAEYDPAKRLLYILMGNENDADGLSARIYTFDNNNHSFMPGVDLDVSRFTFMSMQLYTKTGQLFAVSPGLFNASYPAYSLVEVNPFQGTVTEIRKVTESGIFQKYYGGTVFNGLDSTKGQLIHVFRIADAEADVIATINLDNMDTSFSQLTNIRHVHNLAMGMS